MGPEHTSLERFRLTAQPESIALASLAAQAADEKKGEDILVIDVSNRLAIIDCFVIVTGDNERHVQSIVDEVEDHLAENGTKPLRREGRGEGLWVLLDYGDVVVHVQRRAEREYYALDRLFLDAPQIEVEGVEQVDRGANWDPDAEVDVLDVQTIDDLPLAGPEPDADEL
ncbi:ribosome silencing factor [Corynebacterium sp. MSK039]|uniref:ribosome silencing factor n=1 Tax=Corynebacterium sp. MSK039 TaxID=3050193 RepID=UPI00254E34E0|nr:ribosome silencing factor [Corynebacterium sp. MSK039]MDK8791413.1 ribosome silencing factor [Corynebacterium sp. MSK039]